MLSVRTDAVVTNEAVRAALATQSSGNQSPGDAGPFSPSQVPGARARLGLGGAVDAASGGAAETAKAAPKPVAQHARIAHLAKSRARFAPVAAAKEEAAAAAAAKEEDARPAEAPRAASRLVIVKKIV